MSQKIIDRIKKLLERAKSSNVHEAALAAEMAQELMLKYRISLNEVEIKEQDAEPITSINILAKAGLKSPTTWRAVLLNATCNTNCCRMVIQRGRRGRAAGALHVFGKNGDVQAVSYLFTYFSSEIERLCQEHEVDSSLNKKAFHNNFRLGAAVEIARRMEQKQQQEVEKLRTTGAEKALMRLTDIVKRIDDELKSSTEEVKIRPTPNDERGFEEGVEAGNGVSLGSNKGGLPEPMKQLS